MLSNIDFSCDSDSTAITALNSVVFITLVCNSGDIQGGLYENISFNYVFYLVVSLNVYMSYRHVGA